MSKYGRGVVRYRANGRFAARLIRDGVQHHLGYFDTPEEAAKAFAEAERQMPRKARTRKEAPGRKAKEPRRSVAQTVRDMLALDPPVGVQMVMPDDGQVYTLSGKGEATRANGVRVRTWRWVAKCRYCPDVFETECWDETKGIVRTCVDHRDPRRQELARRSRAEKIEADRMARAMAEIADLI